MLISLSFGCINQRRSSVVRDFVKAATFEGHEIGEPSAISPVLQKITVNVLMSAPRLLLKRELPGSHRAVGFMLLLAVNGDIKFTVLLVTSLRQRGLVTRAPEYLGRWGVSGVSDLCSEHCRGALEQALYVQSTCCRLMTHSFFFLYSDIFVCCICLFDHYVFVFTAWCEGRMVTASSHDD